MYAWHTHEGIHAYITSRLLGLYTHAYISSARHTRKSDADSVPLCVGGAVVCGKRGGRGAYSVAPIALETASKTDPIIPGNAAGITTCLIVSDFVAPIA